jgi:hypothetical protein
MALYQVEGTSLISWSLLVGARSESEASEPALRIVRCLSDLRQDHVRYARLQVVGSCRLVDTLAQDRPDRWWAAQNGIE